MFGAAISKTCSGVLWSRVWAWAFSARNEDIVSRPQATHNFDVRCRGWLC
jgi:hypothetical protein